MSFLLSFHSLFRWVVLAVLLGAGLVGVLQALRRAPWRPGSDRPFLVATMVLDVQVAAGILLWLLGRTWNEGLFLAVIHPVAMLAALGVAHLTVSRARTAEATRAYPIAGSGLLLALVMVLAAIPRMAW